MNHVFESALAARYDDKVASFAAGDITFVDRFYASAAIAVAPGREALVGRDAIRSSYATLLSGSVTAEYRSWQMVQTSPVCGHDFATFGITPERQDPVMMKFLFLWGKFEDGWKCNGYMYIRNEEFPDKTCS